MSFFTSTSAPPKHKTHHIAVQNTKLLQHVLYYYDYDYDYDYYYYFFFFFFFLPPAVPCYSVVAT